MLPHKLVARQSELYLLAALHCMHGPIRVLSLPVSLAFSTLL